jgi:hypothetical protein
MIEKAAYWKSRADHIYTVQITALFCRNTKKQIKEEMIDWNLSASGHSKDKQIMIFKKEIEDHEMWNKIKNKFSFKKILEKVEG